MAEQTTTARAEQAGGVNGYCTCNGRSAGGRMADCGIIPAHRVEARAERAGGDRG